MTQPNPMLATLLRGAQWRLDTAAFEIGAGRYSRENCVALADGLAELAALLRRHADAAGAVEVESQHRRGGR